MQLVKLSSYKFRLLSGKYVCEIFLNVSSFYYNCKDNIEFRVGVMAIRMKNIVLCGVKNTTALAIETTSESAMIKGLMIDIIQKFQSAFSSQVNAFFQ